MSCALFQESGEPYGPLSVKNDQGYGRMAEFQADSIFRSPVQGGFPPVVEYHFVRRPFKSFRLYGQTAVRRKQGKASPYTARDFRGVRHGESGGPV